jgi:DNA-binding transcriptional regulator GbsR (MarR family)
MNDDKKDKIKTITFDPEVYLLEEEFLNHLINSPIFVSKDPIFIKILGYFITREYLTQKDLKRLTGLSTGKISQEVNDLVEHRFIEIANISETGKITYSCKSRGMVILKYAKDITDEVFKWEKQLLEIKSEIEENKEKLKNLKGFEKIYKIINVVLPAVSDYKKIRKLFDNALKNYQ